MLNHFWLVDSVSVDVFFPDEHLVANQTSLRIRIRRRCKDQPCTLFPLNITLYDGVAHSVNTHFECCCFAFYVYSPLGEKNTTNKQLVSRGKEILHLSLLHSWFQLLWLRCPGIFLVGGRKVVDIVLLLQQQHNNKNLHVISHKKSLA